MSKLGQVGMVELKCLKKRNKDTNIEKIPKVNLNCIQLERQSNK